MHFSSNHAIISSILFTFTIIIKYANVLTSYKISTSTNISSRDIDYAKVISEVSDPLLSMSSFLV